MVRRDHGQNVQPRVEGLVDQVVPVEVQHVEEPGPESDLARRFCAETCHRVLERARCIVLVQREGLAVQHDLTHRHPPHHLDDLGQTVRDVREVPCEDPDVLTAPMHLDARAVELVLHGCLTHRRDGLGDRGGRTREHRLDGTPDHEPRVREVLRRAGQGDSRCAREIPGQHCRTAHVRDGPVGGAGDRISQHTLERAGSHLAE